MRITSILSKLEQYAKIQPDKIAIRDKNHSITYRELFTYAERLAPKFANLSKDKQAVIFHSPNCIALIIYYFSCLLANTLIVPVSPKIKTNELKNIISIIKPAVIFSHKQISSLINWDEIMIPLITHSKLTSLENQNLITQQMPKAPAAVFFSSGSTGEPKGIMHSVYSLSAMADNLSECLNLRAHDVYLVTETITNASGFTHVLAAIYNGATVTLTDEELNIHSFKLALKQFQPTILTIMGKLNFDITYESDLTPSDFASVKTCLTGGDKVSTQLIKRLLSKDTLSIKIKLWNE